MIRAARVPASFGPVFEKAERIVEGLFATVDRAPERGTIHVGSDRYVLMRGESLYLALYQALSAAFGGDSAREFLYSTAREIGKSDSRAFSARLDDDDGLARLASGPIHFAYCGWAFVEILDDSDPAGAEGFFLHYTHPNTFESEVIMTRGEKANECACVFSAGYSAGWCSHAFSSELHAREIRCAARGDDRCEFVMSLNHQLDDHETRVLAR
jgi:predicted hydrocarbon binding protein